MKIPVCHAFFASFGIKQKRRTLVKPRSHASSWGIGLIATLLLGAPICAWASSDAPDASPSSSPSDLSASPQPSGLPDIEAKTYEVSLVRVSESGKVYLFERPDGEVSRDGKIVLLKKGEQPIMALRILKSYPDKKRFAAKWVKKYPDHATLPTGETLQAIEKVSDIKPPPITPQDKADLKELESPPASAENTPPAPTAPSALPQSSNSPTPPESPSPSESPTPPSPADAAALPPSAPPEGPKKLDTQEYDPDLDAGTSPPPKAASDLSENEEDEIDELSSITVEEINVIDPDKNWLTLELGDFRNYNPDGTSQYFTGGGFRYGRNVGRDLFFKRKNLQDSLTLELGLSFYKLLNFAQVTGGGDAYSVVPITATGRYNFIFSQNFTTFLYAGLVENFVISAQQPNSDAATVAAVTQARNNLNSYYMTAGAGFLFRVGPSWYTRVDLGFDVIDLGLVLRF